MGVISSIYSLILRSRRILVRVSHLSIVEGIFHTSDKTPLFGNSLSQFSPNFIAFYFLTTHHPLIRN